MDVASLCEGGLHGSGPGIPISLLPFFMYQGLLSGLNHPATVRDTTITQEVPQNA